MNWLKWYYVICNFRRFCRSCSFMFLNAFFVLLLLALFAYAYFSGVLSF